MEFYRHLSLAEVESGYGFAVRDLRLGWPPPNLLDLCPGTTLDATSYQDPK